MSGSDSQTSSLDPSDAVVLERWVIEELVEGSLYGIEAIFAFAVFFMLLRKGLLNSWARSLLFATTVILFGGSTIAIASRVMYYIHHIRQLGDPTYDPFEIMTRWNTAHVVVTRINYLLGDLIVVWRAWILFDTGLVKILLSSCIFVSLGGTIVNLYFTIADVETQGFSDIRFLFPATLLLTNITATVLIGYKTWRYRYFIKRHLGKLSKPTQVEQVLVLLVESGIIYAALWVGNTALQTN
ncbi:hypothetical protein L218DRAFT_940349 [Marasmius fiardii PR-910]|nr:hypothetical protein L218DRAFT_940349 [Marasmius fiardii PR-910]